MRSASIVFLIALFILGCDSDEPTLPQTPTDPEILTAHNKWRSFVGVADMEWSEDLAKKAMALVDGNACEWTINTEGLGQNSISGGDFNTSEEFVDSWARGFQYYIYDLDSCTFPLTGVTPNGNCDHYKQIVWANSTFLGCASVRCFNNTIGHNSYSTMIWVCLYYPPGNIPGERPY